MTESKVRDLLLEYLEQTSGSSVSDISRKTNLNRATVAKYLEGLHQSGVVSYSVVGKAKLWYISASSAKKIIVGSDDSNFFNLIEYSLSDTEYVFVKSTNQYELITALVKDSPDLVVLSVKNENFRNECLSYLKSHESAEIPLIIVGNKDELTEAPSHAFTFDSPFDATALRSRVHQILHVDEGIHHVTGLYTPEYFSQLVKKENLSVNSGILVRVCGGDICREQSGVSNYENVLRIISQLLKEQKDTTDHTWYIGHLSEDTMLMLQCGDASEEHLIPMTEKILSSFRAMIPYLSHSGVAPTIEVRTYGPDKVKELFN